MKLLWALLAAALLFAGPAQANGDAEAAAFNAARIFVPKAMKDPSSADFDWKSLNTRRLRSDQLELGEDSAYITEGVVRGKNSFGAVVPSKWSAIVLESGGKYSTEVVFLDGKVIVADPKGTEILLRIERLKAEKSDAARKEAIEAGQAKAAEAAALNRKESARLADEIRVAKARAQGVEAGKAAAEQLGKAIVRISEKEIASRAKREAVKRKIPEGDRDDFIDAFSGAVEAAKAKSSSR